MTTSPLAEAAAKIRADIRTEGANGDLPPYPPQATIRVRCSRASQMTAIDIHVENVPHSWLIQDGAMSLRSEASLLLESVLLQIARRHYTEDRQQSFLSVHFHVTGEA